MHPYTLLSRPPNGKTGASMKVQLSQKYALYMFVSLSYSNQCHVHPIVKQVHGGIPGSISKNDYICSLAYYAGLYLVGYGVAAWQIVCLPQSTLRVDFYPPLLCAFIWCHYAPIIQTRVQSIKVLSPSPALSGWSQCAVFSERHCAPVFRQRLLCALSEDKQIAH
jgi:hypothetical protein